jgi:hypothetical protein
LSPFADGVARPPHAYNGLKCMLHTVAPAGPRWTKQDNVFGTFELLSRMMQEPWQ